MKKVSILSLHLGYGGIEKSIIALANLLCQKYEVEIACTYCLYDKPAFNLDKKIKVKYLTNDVVPNKDDFKDAVKKKKVGNILKEGFKSFKILKLRKQTMVDYIKNTDSEIIISTRDIFDNWLGKYGKDSVLKIGWEHNHYHGNLKYANKIIKYAKRLDFLVLVSNELKDFYKASLDGSKCRCVYIPNIIDKLPKYLSHLNKKRLISVGRLSEEKGFYDLLEIYKKLTIKHEDWCLDIIGDGPLRTELQEFIDSNNLSDKVRLHGFRDKDYIDNLLHESSIYLMTSYTESFGIVLIEAMSHGVPCIAFSSAEGARELIEDGVNGYLVDNRDYSSYVERVSYLINNKDKRDKLGQEAYASVKKYTGSEVIKLWYDILKEEK